MELNLISFSAFLISLITLIEQGFSQQVQNPFIDPKTNIRKCYVCNSHRDPYCSDEHWDPKMVRAVYCHEYVKLKESFIHGANITHPFVCRKVYHKVTSSGITDYRVYRTCGYTAPNKKTYEDEEEIVNEDRCYKRAGTYEVMVTYCTCLTDECNHGIKSMGGMELWILLVTTLVSLTTISVTRSPTVI